MNTGVIKVADNKGVYMIKMLGDVRLTLSLSFDAFISEMLASPDFCSVIFDLTEAEAIDSTTLGLMAKISLLGRASDHMDPLVISTNPNITRLLETMGFTEILQVVKSVEFASGEFTALPIGHAPLDETVMKDKVLEAHRSLVELDAKNFDTFKELLQSLEKDE